MPQYRDQLDGLRCFLFLWVFLVHADLQRFWYGSYALPVFFIVSGFLITRNILKGETESLKKSLWIFYTRRVLRVFPVYYLICGILWFSGLLAFPAWHYLFVFNVKFFLLSLDGTQHLIEADWTRNGAHFWSLSVEEQFYLLFPITLLLTPKRFRLAMIMFLIATCTASRFWLESHFDDRPWRIYSGALLPVCGEYILFGCAVGYIDRLRKDALQTRLGRGIVMTMVGFGIGATGAIARRNSGLFETMPVGLLTVFMLTVGIAVIDIVVGRMLRGGRTILDRLAPVGLAYGGIAGSIILFNIAKPTDINPYFAQFIPVKIQTLYALLFTSVVWAVWVDPELIVSRIFRFKPLVYLGKISYGLYLFHLIACALAYQGFKYAATEWPKFQEFVLSLSEGWQRTIVAVPGLLLTIVFASASWHAFEAPINNLKRFVPYGRED